jgi:hypothetical protein
LILVAEVSDDFAPTIRKYSKERAPPACRRMLAEFLTKIGAKLQDQDVPCEDWEGAPCDFKSHSTWKRYTWT